MRAVRRAALASARKSAGFTQEGLAEALHVDRSTVIRWESGAQAPLPYLRPKLARLLRASPERLRVLIEGTDPVASPVDGELLAALDSVFGWLDDRCGWAAGTARQKVAARVAKLDRERLAGRAAARSRVARRQVADALAEYYADSASALYDARFGGVGVNTSVVALPEWLDVAWSLDTVPDALLLTRDLPPSAPVDESPAVDRLAESAALGVRATNAPIYRLVDVGVRGGVVRGTVGVAPFAEYALTLDLLETELLDAITTNRLNTLPLRDKYLPDLATVMDIGPRLCAGGALALVAIARPAEGARPADYMLLVQERSGNVVNAARRLAVIPKGFHGPLADHRADTGIGSTLRRELEEELFGRAELDNTVGGQRIAAPMHASRLSEPMRWLAEDSGRMRMECTGFGLNLVSGNYEFAGLIVIEDDEFWARFGGHLEANWEASGLRPYSTLDGPLLTDLVTDPAWSNEGLFALLQGLRRLAALGGPRVDLPPIELISSRR